MIAYEALDGALLAVRRALATVEHPSIHVRTVRDRRAVAEDLIKAEHDIVTAKRMLRFVRREPFEVDNGHAGL